MRARRFAVLVVGMAAAPAWAQPVMLDARAAEAIVHGCATHAVAKKQSHAIVAVDSGGHVVAALRMDGNGSGTGQGEGGGRVGFLDRRDG
jgi:glc operon protein GlcG